MNQKLTIKQIDANIALLNKAKEINTPIGGWVYSIRKALNMTLRQLGKRMDISAPAVIQIEKREISGNISIRVLKHVGVALNMKFVYGFIPQNGSLNKMIEERALKLAEEIVYRSSITMELEDQKISDARIKEAIIEKKDEIKRKMPRYLWD